MAGPNGGVWGNEVIVPAGEKLSPTAAQHVKPAESTQASGDDGAGTNDDGAQGTPPTEPMVRLPDGTEVPVKDYDPYAEQRAKIEQEQSRVDGMLSVINNGNESTTETPTHTGDPPPEHPLLADNPLLKKIEPSAEDASLLSADERAYIEQHNNLVDYNLEQNQLIADRDETYAKEKAAFQKEINTLKDTVGDRFVREDIAQVTALTGVTEQELIAASKATGVTDIRTLATVVVGEKAMQTDAAAAAEAAEAAEAKRVADAGTIGGTSQGTGGGSPNTQPEGRGVKDWRDKEAVGAAYKFGAPS